MYFKTDLWGICGNIHNCVKWVFKYTEIKFGRWLRYYRQFNEKRKITKKYFLSLKLNNLHIWFGHNSKVTN